MKFRSVTLETNELEDMKMFYARVLDLPLVEETSTGFQVQAGFTRLEFKQAESGTTPTYHFAFLIPENKIQEAKRWLDERTEVLRYEGDPYIHFESWEAHSVYFRDPAGNIVEFIARHALKNAASRPFAASQILGLNELGLPANDVAETIRRIGEGTGVRRWKEPSDDFASLGSHESLWIVVWTGRTWFMTDLKAEAHPFEAVFEQGGDRYRIRVEGGTDKERIERL